MKSNIIITILFLIIGSMVLSQEKLKVEYNVLPYFESPVKEDFEIKSVSSLFSLIVDQSESKYELLPKIDNSQQETIGITMSADENTVYKNTKSEKYIEEAAIEDKIFLIKGHLPKIDWKITKETKEIADFLVLKATATLTDENKTFVTAWYSPKLNYKTGPDKFWGLPGLILEIETQINYEDGSKEGIKYVVSKIEALKSNEKIKIPVKGKEITQEEFSRIKKRYLQKLMEMYGGGVDTE
ncbi:MAG: GLPGLI family protein [Moheibacter sp.]